MLHCRLLIQSIFIFFQLETTNDLVAERIFYEPVSGSDQEFSTSLLFTAPGQKEPPKATSSRVDTVRSPPTSSNMDALLKVKQLNPKMYSILKDAYDPDK